MAVLSACRLSQLKLEQCPTLIFVYVSKFGFLHVRYDIIFSNETKQVTFHLHSVKNCYLSRKG